MNGTGVPLATPFDEDGDVREDDLRRLVTELEDCGVDFFVPCGSNSEAALMSVEERANVTRIVAEELEHFHQVLAWLDRRRIRFRRLQPGPYGRRLNACVRPHEPHRAVDRLLVASLIEARSCERFDQLQRHLGDRDPELAAFYAGLFESEARHHTTYVQLAEHFAARDTVRVRLEELAAAESAILAEGSPLPRMHS